jgi:hypothetical protein
MSASLFAEGPPALANLRSQDAAIVMSHSFEQDTRALASLLAREARPAYIGVLGPQRRTRELLAEAARLLGFHSDSDTANNARTRMVSWENALTARTSDRRSQVDCGSGRDGVKGQDERQRAAPLTPSRPQKGFSAPGPGK